MWPRISARCVSVAPSHISSCFVAGSATIRMRRVHQGQHLDAHSVGLRPARRLGPALGG